MQTLSSEKSKSQDAVVSKKFKRPKRWSSAVGPTAVPIAEFSSGQNYVKKWRLPAPPDAEDEVEAQSGEVSVDLAEPADEQDERIDAKEEDEDDEVDDLAFLGSALRASRKER